MVKQALGIWLYYCLQKPNDNIAADSLYRKFEQELQLTSYTTDVEQGERMNKSTYPSKESEEKHTQKHKVFFKSIYIHNLSNNED